jgi:short subunit dehydrogenase-like uncharacterized protein
MTSGFDELSKMSAEVCPDRLHHPTVIAYRPMERLRSARARPVAMTIPCAGSRGYQGFLTAAELISRGIEPALVGRDPRRLATAASKLARPNADQQIAKIDDVASMMRAFKNCDSAINCAGPFTR